jgi:hypothetical protein
MRTKTNPVPSLEQGIRSETSSRVLQVLSHDVIRSDESTSPESGESRRGGVQVPPIDKPAAANLHSTIAL